MDWRRWTLACVLVSGCYAADDGALAGESYMEDDFPPWSCMDGSSTGECESSGGLEELSCQGSADCPGGQVCAAQFDGEIGTFSCGLACVPNDDEAHWCFDDDACCDGTSVCIRGLCLPSGSETTGTGESSSGVADETGTSSEPTSASEAETSADTDTTGEASSGDASTGGTG